MSNTDRTSLGQLIKPRAYLPWSVEIVSAVPVSIMRLGEDVEPKKKKKRMTTALDTAQINAGAVCKGWACLASPKGSVYVWPVGADSYDAESLTASPAKKGGIDPPKGCVALFHPSLLPPPNVDVNRPLLVALTPGLNDGSVFVYACHPAHGYLLAWKVTHDDVKKASTIRRVPGHYAQVKLPLNRNDDDDEEEDDNDNKETDETVASISVVDRQMVVLGTSSGGLILCTQSTVPVALQAQRLIPPKGRKSFGSFLFSSSKNDDLATESSSPVIFSLPLPGAGEDTTELLAMSAHGTIWHWKIKQTVAKNHSVTCEVSRLASLVTLLQNNLSQSIANLSQVLPLEAKLLENRLHVIVRTIQNDDGECRLYWVRLWAEREGSKVNLACADAIWLNRFPAPRDVKVRGLVLSSGEGQIAYAAFHQRSGGVTSSVIIMALANSDVENEPSSTVYEVDLPMTEVPALLPDTLTNDIETHGCCVLARSGLGIRVRLIPPETPMQALSPRAAARANPSAVLKLASHLRSAFYEAYQHLDPAAGGSLALPPSLVEANSVDLEEAVLAVATQLHVQANSDTTGTGWESAKLQSNRLEWHLALIQWLRRGGIYRSLTAFAKWKLLALGQEVAAFLELATPTVLSASWVKEQYADLSLAKGIAVWLQERLDAVLNEGDLDHYQTWCGWFSTVLATATTYREERATPTYDITLADKPPLIGSTDEHGSKSARIPWTSHPALQEVFGRLLLHWRHSQQKSVHMLPPQTVEVICKAALESFADSASSVGSEQATGKYAEIKAMTIPLLRRLYPRTKGMSTSRPGGHSDQLAYKLAVKHDYYDGICQIAHDHENASDKNNFRVEPLLQSATQCQSIDHSTGFTFGQFVLHWHAEKCLYGQTIMYGRLCPEQDLNQVFQSNERLRSYKWIQAIHHGHYDLAVSSLMSRTGPLSETRWSFCMAKLSNQVVLKDQSKHHREAESRQKKIESTLELCGIQKELLEISLERTKSDQPLWSPKNLLTNALEKAAQVSTSDSSSAREEATRYCYLGLLVCTTFEDEAARRGSAVQVWAKCITVDWENWTEWIRTENDLSRDALAYTVIDNTVFGGLMKECGEDKSLDFVTFSSQRMENEIIEQLGLTGGSGTDSLRRLLQNVTQIFQATAAADEED